MELLQIPWFDWLDETVALPPALTNFLEPCASVSKALFESFVPRGFSLKSNSALPSKSNDFFEKDVLALRSTDVSRGLGAELCTLEGHSNMEDEEKCADGQDAIINSKLIFENTANFRDMIHTDRSNWRYRPTGEL